MIYSDFLGGDRFSDSPDPSFSKYFLLSVEDSSTSLGYPAGSPKRILGAISGTPATILIPVAHTESTGVNCTPGSQSSTFLVPFYFSRFSPCWNDERRPKTSELIGTARVEAARSHRYSYYRVKLRSACIPGSEPRSAAKEL